jgi:hypothetical protein
VFAMPALLQDHRPAASESEIVDGRYSMRYIWYFQKNSGGNLMPCVRSYHSGDRKNLGEDIGTRGKPRQVRLSTHLAAYHLSGHAANSVNSSALLNDSPRLLSKTGPALFFL